MLFPIHSIAGDGSLLFAMASMGMNTLQDKPQGPPPDKQSRETYLLRVARAVVDKMCNLPGWDDAMWEIAGMASSAPEQFEPYCL